MAKKGGQQQLQAEINSDEELFKFIDRPGLIVLDVYSEWCGPCVAMVGSLKKVKLEVGGDDLHLAICKSDTIDVFERYRNKSEPVWLFVTKSKLVNIMFGSDVPKLMNLIETELGLLESSKRAYYELHELQPEEKARRDIIEKALAEARQKEIQEEARQKKEYLDHVTDEIMANLPENGVTIFGPHIARDVYKKLMEVADRYHMQVKDRRTTQLLPEHFDIVNYACENPIDPEVLQHMFEKDVLLCYWKVSLQPSELLEEVFREYTIELTSPKKVFSETGELEDTLPPLIKPLEIKLSTKLEGKPVKEIEVKKAEPPPPPPEEVPEAAVDETEAIIPADIDLPGSDSEAEDKAEEEVVPEEAPVIEEVPSSTSSDAQIILVPPVWVPTDRRTHATLIYVFFRQQTQTFLPPDPVPDPPHVVMAFDAYKKKDIFEVISKHEENVLFYGFFTNDDPHKAKLIANTLGGYEAEVPKTTDKLVLKVAKKTSHTMLAFVAFGPTFVSSDTVAGKEHALQFFPEGYTNNPNAEKPEDDEEKEKAKK